MQRKTIKKTVGNFQKKKKRGGDRSNGQGRPDWNLTGAKMTMAHRQKNKEEFP